MDFTLNNVNLYCDSRLLLKNLNFKFDTNKTYFFFGRSGVGKSLLLESMSGLYKNFEGTIYRPDDYQRTSSYLFQKDPLIPWLTVKENFILVNIDLKLAYEHLQYFELTKILTMRAANLSVGEMQMVSLIRALLTRPKFLFFDEPFSALDFYSKKKAYKLLLGFIAQKNRSLTIFAVSHDLEEICLFADEVLFLNIEKLSLDAVLKKSEINFNTLQNLISVQSYV